MIDVGGLIRQVNMLDRTIGRYIDAVVQLLLLHQEYQGRCIHCVEKDYGGSVKWPCPTRLILDGIHP